MFHYPHNHVEIAMLLLNYAPILMANIGRPVMLTAPILRRL
jgi:hypothetical protein